MKTVLCAINAKYTHSSLALRYIEKYNAGRDICICEYTINDSIYNIYKSLLNEKADIYAFSCYIWNIEVILKVAEMIKKAMPLSIIMLGGPEASYNAKGYLTSPYIDYVMLGEGEHIFKEIFENINNLENVNGLAGKDFINNKFEPLDLSTVPLPYNKKDLEMLNGKIIYFETSRGCPFRCSYCLSSAQGKIRYFPMEYVKKGFDLFFENNVPLVKLIDRTFNADKERAKEIIQYIIENSKNTRVHFEVAPHILDDELIELLNSAPKDMFQLEMGIQSTNPDTLKNINRNVDLEIIKENILKISKNNNMHIHLDLIAGLPYEDYSSFKKSFNYVFDLKPQMLQLGFLKVLHGTEISKNNDINYCSFPPYEVISTKWITREEICILKDIDNAVDKFYNNGGFENTLNKLYENDGFGLFYKLSKLISGKTVSKATLYSILYNEYGDSIYNELILDFLLNNKDTKLPSFIKETRPDNYKKIYYSLIKDDNFLSTYNIEPEFKNLRFEAVNNTVYMVDYKNNKIYNIGKYFN